MEQKKHTLTFTNEDLDYFNGLMMSFQMIFNMYHFERAKDQTLNDTEKWCMKMRKRVERIKNGNK